MDGFLIKRPEGNLSAYLEEREEFFRRMNEKCAAAHRSPQFLDVKMAARIYDVVPLPDGGYNLVKRTVPLMDDDDDLGGHNRLAAAMSATLGERKGLNAKKGKYNDAGIIEMQEEEKFGKAEMFGMPGW